MVMRGITTTLIILGLLTGNIAWAADYDELISSVDDVSTQVSPDHEDPLSQTDCDHCCHGSAHLIGLLPVTTTKHVTESNRYSTVTFIANTTQTYQPPTPPPNA